MLALEGDHGLWVCRFRLEKFEGDIGPFQARGAEHEFYEGRLALEVIEGERNLLVNTGIDVLLQLLTTTGSPTAFSAANAYIGVGDSATAAAASQTDLQASTNKLRKAMDSTYPLESSQLATFKSSFGSSEANFHWQEWGIFNGSSGGTMLNRKVTDLGTKTTGTWALTVTVGVS